MKKSHIGIGVVIVIVILAIIGGAVWRQQKHSKYVQSTTPTLFFHGGGSSYHAEEHMVNTKKNSVPINLLNTAYALAPAETLRCLEEIIDKYS